MTVRRAEPSLVFKEEVHCHNEEWDSRTPRSVSVLSLERDSRATHSEVREERGKICEMDVMDVRD